MSTTTASPSPAPAGIPADSAPAVPRAPRPLRVLYLWDADYPWDVRTEKVCAALTQAGHSVHIVARNRERRPLVEQLPEGTVHRMPPWRLVGRKLDALLGFPAFFNPRWISLLAATIRRERPDVIIVRDLPLCPTALQAGRRAGLPVVLDMAENYPAMMRELWETGRQRPIDWLVRNPAAVSWIERRCLPRLDAVITVVEESSERVAELGVPADRLTVVSNTPPWARAAGTVERRRRDGEPMDVVYLGLLELHRGLGELVEAAALLRDDGVPVRVRIVGGGRDETILRELARTHGLGEELVRFYGRVSHAEALRLIESADVGIVPHRADESWNTTIPNKLFDYMAVGLAVVASDARPTARVVRETGAGLVFRSGDARAIADALRQLADPAVRDAHARAGREAVRSRYHWERDVEALLRVVDRVATSHPSSTFART